MAKSAAWEWQKAAYAALSADSNFMAKASRLLDSPLDQDYPYVVMGDMTETALDTFGADGSQPLATFHIYSRYAGMKEAAEILAELVRVLDGQKLVLSGFDTVIAWYAGSDTFRDPDGITRRIAARFRVQAVGVARA